MREQRLLALLAALASVALSLGLHMPVVNPHPVYSDIVSIYYQVFITRERMYGDGAIPYHDYFLEYPPLVGYLWLVSGIVSLAFEYPWNVLAHYLVHGLVLGVCIVASIYLLGVLGELLGVEDPWRRSILAALLPSTIIYGIYNWDFLALCPLLAAYTLLAAGRHRLAGVFFGLAVAGKLYPLAVLPAIIRVYGRRGVIAVVYALATAAGLSAIIVVEPTAALRIVEYHSGWYIEGSWLLLLAHDPWDPIVRSISKILMAFMFIVPLLLPVRPNNAADAVKSGVITIGLLLLTSYVYTPQMNILVAPLMALLLPAKLLPILVVQDAAAAYVILLWFGPWNPLDKFSPPSIASYVKCFLLGLLVAWLIYEMFKMRSAAQSSR